MVSNLEIKFTNGEMKVISGNISYFPLIITDTSTGEILDKSLCVRGFYYDGYLWYLEKDTRKTLNEIFPESVGCKVFRSQCEKYSRDDVRVKISKSSGYDKLSKDVKNKDKFPSGSWIAIRKDYFDYVVEKYNLEISIEDVGGTVQDTVNNKIPDIGCVDTYKKYLQLSEDMYNYIETNLKDKDVIESFYGYLEMRKSKKMPISISCIKLLIKNLRQISNNRVSVAVSCLEKATVKGWKNIYL